MVLIFPVRISCKFVGDCFYVMLVCLDWTELYWSPKNYSSELGHSNIGQRKLIWQRSVSGELCCWKYFWFLLLPRARLKFNSFIFFCLFLFRVIGLNCSPDQSLILLWRKNQSARSRAPVTSWLRAAFCFCQRFLCCSSLAFTDMTS